jgi:hypothetical protein
VRVCSRRANGRRVTAAGCVGLAVAALTSPVDALELEFSKGCPCPSEEIAFRVENALAQSLASIPGPTFHVDVERVPSGYLGRVRLAAGAGDAAHGERRVTASSCDELVDTLALTLVLAVAEQRDFKASANAPSDQLARPADDTIAPASPAPAQARGDVLGSSAVSPAESSTGARLAAFGALVGDAGSLPSFGLGVAVGADVAWPSLELRASGVLLPGAEGSVHAGDPTSPGARIGLVAGGLSMCAPLATRVVSAELAACVGAELGRLSGHGTQIDTPHSSATWWSAPRADLALRWALPLPRLALELGVTVAAPIWRHEFVLEGVGSVHRAAPVVGRGSLSLRADLGP